MKEKNTVFSKILFGLEFALVLVIPFVIWHSTTPTNVLNSNSLYKLLEIAGICGRCLLPAGKIQIFWCLKPKFFTICP